MGILAFNEKNEVVEKVLFPKDAEKVAEKILRIEAGWLIDEVEELFKKLDGFKDAVFVFENEGLARSVHEKFNVKVEVEKPSTAGEYLRGNLGSIAVKVGFVEKPEEFYGFIRETSTVLTRIKVRKKAMRRDKIVIQLINTLDELDKTLNLFAGRIGEWYGIHFPELNKIVDSHETYARLVKSFGLRENFNVESLTKLGLPESKAKKIVESAKNSIGAPMDEKDIETLQTVCGLYLEMAKTRRLLSEKIEELMEDVAPNLKAVAGHTLGARLIALGGGLEELAKLPASTFQVLGAEKALFRALRTGAKPPKHGVIFQHPFVHQSPRWQRGKIARALAGKLAIAARIDAFSGVNQAGKLKAELEKRVQEIKEKYKTPPPKPKKSKKKRGRR
ncbi:MAG: C/D box methylation guide ribonucleoprotein complex aNOP56 subunit [Candidatus Hecatellales archaeon]|nr:MAG: C/D box methylation guide ribonucleoprotein complex aNOP56 subunit [Candidatus Hecatellales archaeon]